MLADGAEADYAGPAVPLSSEELDRAFAFFDIDADGQGTIDFKELNKLTAVAGGRRGAPPAAPAAHAKPPRPPRAAAPRAPPSPPPPPPPPPREVSFATRETEAMLWGEGDDDDEIIGLGPRGREDALLWRVR